MATTTPNYRAEAEALALQAVERTIPILKRLLADHALKNPAQPIGNDFGEMMHSAWIKALDEMRADPSLNLQDSITDLFMLCDVKVQECGDLLHHPDEFYQALWEKLEEFVAQYVATRGGIDPVAEQQHRESEKAAERKRQAAEKRAKEKAEQKRLEEERRAAEEARKAEQARMAAEKKAEQARIAAEKKAEKERIEAEKKAEKERLEAEKRAKDLAEQARIAAEKAEAEKKAAEKTKATPAKKEYPKEEPTKKEPTKATPVKEEAPKAMVEDKGPGVDWSQYDLTKLINERVKRAMDAPYSIKGLPTLSRLEKTLNPFLIDLAKSTALKDVARLDVFQKVIYTKGKYLPTANERRLFLNDKDPWAVMITGVFGSKKEMKEYADWMMEHRGLNAVSRKAIDDMKDYLLREHLHFYEREWRMGLGDDKDEIALRVSLTYSDDTNGEFRTLLSLIEMLEGGYGGDTADGYALNAIQKHADNLYLLFNDTKIGIPKEEITDIIVANKELGSYKVNLGAPYYSGGKKYVSIDYDGLSYKGKYHYDSFDRRQHNFSSNSDLAAYVMNVGNEMEEYELFDHALFLYRRALDSMIARGYLTVESIRRRPEVEFWAGWALREVIGRQMYARCIGKLRGESYNLYALRHLRADLNRYWKYLAPLSWNWRFPDYLRDRIFED